jgi:heme-degrading monooxygenase HmoA
MFIVVYWWRVKPGREEQFREGWRRGTAAITRTYGSLGSRLCRTEDGRFVGVAEWPDRDTWRKAFDAKMVYDDPEAREMFLDAIDGGPGGRAPAFSMEVLDDLLQPAGEDF